MYIINTNIIINTYYIYIIHIYLCIYIHISLQKFESDSRTVGRSLIR